MGEENGGVILNLSEGGVYVQAMAPVNDGQVQLLNFHLPGTWQHIETNGQVIWSGESKKDARMQFVNLPDRARQKITEWVSADVYSFQLPLQKGALPEMLPRNPLSYGGAKQPNRRARGNVESLRYSVPQLGCGWRDCFSSGAPVVPSGMDSREPKHYKTGTLAQRTAGRYPRNSS